MTSFEERLAKRVDKETGLVSAWLEEGYTEDEISRLVWWMRELDLETDSLVEVKRKLRRL
jgi:hypothetical protein